MTCYRACSELRPFKPKIAKAYAAGFCSLKLFSFRSVIKQFFFKMHSPKRMYRVSHEICEYQDDFKVVFDLWNHLQSLFENQILEVKF